MQIQFEMTVAEIKECKSANANAYKHGPPRVYYRRLLGWALMFAILLWMPFGAFFIVPIINLISSSESMARSGLATSAIQAIPYIVSFLCCLLLILILWCLIRHKEGDNFNLRYSPTDNGGLLRRLSPTFQWVPYLAIFYTAYLMIVPDPTFLIAVYNEARNAVSRMPAHGFDFRRSFDQFLPWIILILFGWYSFTILGPKSPRKLAAEFGRMTYDITPELVTATTSSTRARVRWPTFLRVIETPNVFMLYISVGGYHLIPKRAFATAADCDAFRALALAKIPLPAYGFPVEEPTAATPRM